MEKILLEYPEVDAVMTVNDPTGMGVYEVLQKLDRINQISIFSVDGSPEGKLMVKYGLFASTAAQSPITIGRIAAEQASSFLNGFSIEKRIVVPVFLITREDINEFKTIGWQ